MARERVSKGRSRSNKGTSGTRGKQQKSGWVKPDGTPLRKRKGEFFPDGEIDKQKTRSRSRQQGSSTGDAAPGRNESSDRESSFRRNDNDDRKKPFRRNDSDDKKTSFRRTENDDRKKPFRRNDSDDKKTSFRRTENDDRKKPFRRNDSEDPKTTSRSNDSARDDSNKKSDRKPFSARGDFKKRDEKSESRSPRERSDRKSFSGDNRRKRDDFKSTGDRGRSSFGSRNKREPEGDDKLNTRDAESTDKSITRDFDRPERSGTSDFEKTDRSGKPDFDKPRKSFGKREGFRKDSFRRDDKRNFNKGKSPGKRYDPETQTEGVRLNKFIANAGICSRREADDLISAGVISVNGKIVTELGTKVMPTDEVKFHEQPLRTEKLVYVLLNKPKDYITTTDDPEERKTVMNLVRDAGRERLFPVGRLDRNTTGLLLITNDGDLTKRLTHPSSNITKIYQVELDRNLSQDDMIRAAEGVELEDGLAQVDEIQYTSPVEKNIIGVELHSGRNRVVRRIFESMDYRVVKLDRVSFAGLTKKDLPRGRWRFLTEMEVNMLKMLTGKKK